MYMNDKEAIYEKVNCDGEEQLNENEFKCCSSHMTLFTVMDLPKGIEEIHYWTSFVVPAVIILDFYMLLMIIVTCYLDKKGLS